MPTKELKIKIHRWEKTNTRLYKPAIVETKFMHLEEHCHVSTRAQQKGDCDWREQLGPSVFSSLCPLAIG